MMYIYIYILSFLYIQTVRRKKRNEQWETKEKYKGETVVGNIFDKILQRHIPQIFPSCSVKFH